MNRLRDSQQYRQHPEPLPHSLPNRTHRPCLTLSFRLTLSVRLNPFQTCGWRSRGHFVSSVFCDCVSGRLDVFRSGLFERDSVGTSLTTRSAAVSISTREVTDGAGGATTISALCRMLSDSWIPRLCQLLMPRAGVNVIIITNTTVLRQYYQSDTIVTRKNEIVDND